MRRFDAPAVLSSPEALHALRLMAGRVRSGNAPPVRWLLGELPPEHVAALVAAGAVDEWRGGVWPRFSLVLAPPAVVVVPRPAGHDDVYFGPDSRLLLRAARRLVPEGKTALDLGTGTGYLAAALAARFHLTVATDLAPSAAAVAALTLAVGVDEARAAVCMADGSAGLRPGSFDVVVANPPWQPADVPNRLLGEVASLLAPGGLGLVLCFDASAAGGRRPFQEACARLADRGTAVEIEPATPRWAELTRWPSGELVIAVLRRPRAHRRGEAVVSSSSPPVDTARTSASLR